MALAISPDKKLKKDASYEVVISKKKLRGTEGDLDPLNDLTGVMQCVVAGWGREFILCIAF